MIKIDRWYLQDCTIGRLSHVDDMNVVNFQCFTLELPMLDNKSNVSCILPADAYNGVKHKSPNNGDVIAITNVFERTHIQIHSGNYTSQIRGCILVGDSIKFLNNDLIPDITNSKATLQKLLSILPDSFNIQIR